MNISIVTITCRQDPRLAAMAQSLVASMLDPTSVAKGTEFRWIIVDENKRSEAEIDEIDAIANRAEGRLTIRRVSPLASAAPLRHQKLPAHNSFRNAGLFAVGDDTDFVVFLNDCTVVSQKWALTVHEVASLGIGWKCHQVSVGDMALNRPIANGVTSDTALRVVPPSTLSKSLCWGAPLKAWQKIGGFDLAYDGQFHGSDLEAVVRLERVGVKFQTSFKASVVRLQRTATKADISSDKDALRGIDNRKRLNELQRDRGRDQPEVSGMVREGKKDDKKKTKAEGKKAKTKKDDSIKEIPPAAAASSEEALLDSLEDGDFDDAIDENDGADPESAENETEK